MNFINLLQIMYVLGNSTFYLQHTHIHTCRYNIYIYIYIYIAYMYPNKLTNIPLRKNVNKKNKNVNKMTNT